MRRTVYTWCPHPSPKCVPPADKKRLKWRNARHTKPGQVGKVPQQRTRSSASQASEEADGPSAARGLQTSGQEIRHGLHFSTREALQGQPPVTFPQPTGTQDAHGFTHRPGGLVPSRRRAGHGAPGLGRMCQRGALRTAMHPAAKPGGVSLTPAFHDHTKPKGKKARPLHSGKCFRRQLWWTFRPGSTSCFSRKKGINMCVSGKF